MSSRVDVASRNEAVEGLVARLGLRVDRALPSSLNDQLYRRIRAAIESGRLAPGLTLPASRELATALGVARGVVVAAYARLAQEGWVVGRQGSGTRVAGRVPSIRLEHPWRRYVAIGDSITEGFGMDPVEGVEHLPWPERVARELRRSRPGLEYRNLAYRGLRAAEIVERQLDVALELRPDLVSIAAGPNDLLAEDFSRAQIARDLEPLYASFAETEATVFTFSFLNMPASGVLPEDGARWLAERMETLHEVIESYARRYGALFIDLYRDPRGARKEWWSADLQHANAAGQAFVAERTIDALATLVSEGRAPRALGRAS